MIRVSAYGTEDRGFKSTPGCVLIGIRTFQCGFFLLFVIGCRDLKKNPHVEYAKYIFTKFSYTCKFWTQIR
jgi:hypothetical protein